MKLGFKMLSVGKALEDQGEINIVEPLCVPIFM